MDMLSMTTAEFTEALASKSSVPGGGGAAALVGSIAVSLGDMVGEFTVGKQKYADVEGVILSLMTEAQDLRQKLLLCIEEDARAFEPLSRAYGLPKETEGRDEILEQCLVDAAAVPMKILKLCADALTVIGGFAEKGSRLMISDAACGAILCKAAMQSAAMNVKVNTRLMKDREVAEKTDREVEDILREKLPAAEMIFTEIYQ